MSSPPLDFPSSSAGGNDHSSQAGGRTPTARRNPRPGLGGMSSPAVGNNGKRIGLQPGGSDAELSAYSPGLPSTMSSPLHFPSSSNRGSVPPSGRLGRHAAQNSFGARASQLSSDAGLAGNGHSAAGQNGEQPLFFPGYVSTVVGTIGIPH